MSRNAYQKFFGATKQALTAMGTKSVTLIKASNVSHRQYGTKLATKPLSNYSALYGGQHTITMLPGDGIGPEMMEHVKTVCKAAQARLAFEEVVWNKYQNTDADFQKSMNTTKRCGVAIKGSRESEYADPTYNKSRNASMRVELGLFASVMHCKTYPNVRARHAMDLVVIRQNTEGEYAMLEHETVPGVVESMKVITTKESEKLGRFAFDYAVKHGRKKISCIHKANIQKLSDGLFLETIREISQDYPQIEFNDLIVDNTCMQLTSNPGQFDVLVAPNLYGLIAQTVICGLAGGAGLFSGGNYGDKVAVFEPGCRSTATNLENNVGNPIAMLNASVDMLLHLKQDRAAAAIADAIHQTLVVDKVHTIDLGGTFTTQDVVDNIVKHIKMKESWFFSSFRQSN